ncbi:uncharacterized protein DEA37_0014712 [Paragonimus westermani]|uniref:Uncharacterized protein n=1 Tax=Paragonimus westermani TaxID=34504 RepID=A0A5J4NKZ8_9TREM|nr:uncharacterized protein DEA37_0014712 [Paragonimus westermani]
MYPRKIKATCQGELRQARKNHAHSGQANIKGRTPHPLKRDSILVHKKPWNSSVRVEQSNVNVLRNDRRQKLPFYPLMKPKAGRPWSTCPSTKQDTIATSATSLSQVSKVSELLDESTITAGKSDKESGDLSSLDVTDNDAKQLISSSIENQYAIKEANNQTTAHIISDTDSTQLRSHCTELESLISKVCVWYLKVRTSINEKFGKKLTPDDAIHQVVSKYLDQLQTLLGKNLPNDLCMTRLLHSSPHNTTNKSPAKLSGPHTEGDGPEPVIQLAQNNSYSLSTDPSKTETKVTPKTIEESVQCSSEVEYKHQESNSTADTTYQNRVNTTDNSSPKPRLETAIAEGNVNTYETVNFAPEFTTASELEPEGLENSRVLSQNSNTMQDAEPGNWESSNLIRGSNSSNHYHGVVQSQTTFKLIPRSQLANHTHQSDNSFQLARTQSHFGHEQDALKHYARMFSRRHAPQPTRSSDGESNGYKCIHPSQDSGQPRKLISRLVLGTVYTKTYVGMYWSVHIELYSNSWYQTTKTKRVILQQQQQPQLRPIKIFSVNKQTSLKQTRIRLHSIGHLQQQGGEVLSVKAILLRGPAEEVESDHLRLVTTGNAGAKRDATSLPPLPDPPPSDVLGDEFLELPLPHPPAMGELYNATSSTKSMAMTTRINHNLVGCGTTIRNVKKPSVPYLLWRCANVNRNVHTLNLSSSNSVNHH